LSVITDSYNTCETVKTFLTINNILCGTVEEQIYNSNIVAVESFSATLSFEWPIVFIISLESTVIDDTFILIAASRAIASLTIINQQDNTSFERDIEECNISVSTSQFEFAAKKE
jgi:hypothetical protein